MLFPHLKNGSSNSTHLQGYDTLRIHLETFEMSSMYQILTLKTTISRRRSEMNADTGWIPEGTARAFFSSYSLHKDTSPVLSDCYFLHWTKDEVEQMAFKVALMLKSQ